MPTRSALVNERLEAICQCGCEAVRATIEALERSQPVALANDLDDADRTALLAELKAIMDVYDRPRAVS